MMVLLQSVTNIIVCQNVTDILYWFLDLEVGDITCHQHHKLVNNTFDLQHTFDAICRKQFENTWAYIDPVYFWYNL